MSRADIEVVRAVSEIAVRNTFSSDDDVRKITKFVAGLRERFGPKSPGALEIEALIRASLGETEVEVADIPILTVFAAAILVASLLAFQRNLTESQADELVIAAESLAAERGWHPVRAE